MIMISAIIQTNIYRLVSCIDINNIKIINITKICVHAYLKCTEIDFNANDVQVMCNWQIFLITQYGLELLLFIVLKIHVKSNNDDVIVKSFNFNSIIFAHSEAQEGWPWIPVLTGKSSLFI